MSQGRTLYVGSSHLVPLEMVNDPPRYGPAWETRRRRRVRQCDLPPGPMDVFGGRTISETVPVYREKTRDHTTWKKHHPDLIHRAVILLGGNDLVNLTEERLANPNTPRRHCHTLITNPIILRGTGVLAPLLQSPRWSRRPMESSPHFLMECSPHFCSRPAAEQEHYVACYYNMCHVSSSAPSYLVTSPLIMISPSPSSTIIFVTVWSPNMSSLSIFDGDRYASPTPDDGIKNTKLKVWRHEQLRACVRCIFHKIQK